jgi:hypothetical protein
VDINVQHKYEIYNGNLDPPRAVGRSYVTRDETSLERYASISGVAVLTLANPIRERLEIHHCCMLNKYPCQNVLTPSVNPAIY